jgi:hypothetical protein
MRRHYASYFKGIEGFKDYRIRLVTEDSAEAVRNLLAEIQDTFAERPLQTI